MRGVLLAILVLLLPGAATAETEVDLELCLASDGSGSIAPDEFAFQRQGFAAAIASDEVRAAIESGFRKRIAIGYMDLVATIGGISLMQTGKEMETMIIVLLTYLVLSLSISAVMNWYNQRIKLVER